jgi:CBS domain-containing protein
MTVAQILEAKGRNVETGSPEEPVAAIAGRLAQRRIGSVVIVDNDGSIAGIVSERDIVRALAERGAGALAMPARAVMTSPVRTCSPSDSEAELMALMTEYRIRHLPVMENGRLAGMISIGDVVKFRIQAIEREAEEMKSYIASAG